MSSLALTCTLWPRWTLSLPAPPQQQGLPEAFPQLLEQLVLVCALPPTMCVKSLQLYPVLCNSVDCNQPGSSVRGILQAGILEWVAMPSSRGS